MAYFPHFRTQAELLTCLDNPAFRDLGQLDDSGRTYFSAIVNQIHLNNSSPSANQKDFGQSLANFIQIVIEQNLYDLSSTLPDAQGFTPVGHLFKHFVDRKSAKHVFRKLIDSKLEIDWYQNTKLNDRDTATGPILYKALTQTTPRNVLKRIEECKAHNIELNFATLKQDDNVSFATHLVTSLNIDNGGIDASKLRDVLLALKDYAKVDTIFLSELCIPSLTHSGAIIPYILDILQDINYQTDFSMLPLLSQMLFCTATGLNTSMSNLDSLAEITAIVKKMSQIQSLHNGEAALNFNHIFPNIQEGSNPFGPIQDIYSYQNITTPSLINHILHLIPRTDAAPSKVIALLKALKENNIEIDLNVKDSAGHTGWQHLSNKMFGTNGRLEIKKAFKDIMKLKYLPNEELVSLFARYMQIDEVINICDKHNYTLSFSKLFNPNNVNIDGGISQHIIPRTNHFPNMGGIGPQRSTSIIDMFFSIWIRQKQSGSGIHDLSMIKKMQNIDQDLDLEYRYSNGAAQFRILDCIASRPGMDSIVDITAALEQEGVVLQMHSSDTKKLAECATYPSTFHKVKNLKMFQNSSAKLKAEFVQHLDRSNLLAILRDFSHDNIEIDFSDNMQWIVNFIEGHMPHVQQPYYGYSAPVIQPHTPWQLMEILSAITADNIMLDFNNIKIPASLVQMRGAHADSLEILKILLSFEQKLSYDINDIAINTLTPLLRQSDQKKAAIEVLSKFQTNMIDWHYVFSNWRHASSCLSEDLNMVQSVVQNLDITKIYKTLLTNSTNLPEVLDLLRDKGVKIEDIQDDNGDTGLHFIAQRPMLCHLAIQHLINFNATNNEGETVFVRMISSQNPSNLLNALQMAWYLLELQNIDVNQKNAEGNGVLSLIAQSYTLHDGDLSSYASQLKSLLVKTKPSGEFWFNVNQVDSSGQRFIDYLAKYFNAGRMDIDCIQILRECGSVEPKETIKSPLRSVDRLDLSDGKLDSHAPNKTNVVKLVDMMYKKYHIQDEQHMDQVIASFKAKDFGTRTVAWGDGITTIPQVIDAIVTIMGRNMQDRISQHVDCKKMIATVIQIVESNPNHTLKHSLYGELPLGEAFELCLTDLAMCHLGKLINIIACVQDVIIATDETNYETKDFDGEYVPILQKIFVNLYDKLGAIAPKAVVEWVYDMSDNTKPEDWNLLTTRVHGIINEGFRASGIVNSCDSYHFNGVLNHPVRLLASKLNPGCDEDILSTHLEQSWGQRMNEGINMKAHVFCVEVLRVAGNGDDICKLFDDFSFNPQKAYGHFTRCNPQIFLDAMGQMSPQTRLEFILSLYAEATLGEEIKHIVAREIMISMENYPQLLQETMVKLDCLKDVIHILPHNVLGQFEQFLITHHIHKGRDMIAKIVVPDIMEDMLQQLCGEVQAPVEDL